MRQCRRSVRLLVSAFGFLFAARECQGGDKPVPVEELCAQITLEPRVGFIFVKNTASLCSGLKVKKPWCNSFFSHSAEFLQALYTKYHLGGHPLDMQPSLGTAEICNLKEDFENSEKIYADLGKTQESSEKTPGKPGSESGKEKNTARLVAESVERGPTNAARTEVAKAKDPESDDSKVAELTGGKMAKPNIVESPKTGGAELTTSDNSLESPSEKLPESQRQQKASETKPTAEVLRQFQERERFGIRSSAVDYMIAGLRDITEFDQDINVEIKAPLSLLFSDEEAFFLTNVQEGTAVAVAHLAVAGLRQLRLMILAEMKDKAEKTEALATVCKNLKDHAELQNRQLEEDAKEKAITHGINPADMIQSEKSATRSATANVAEGQNRFKKSASSSERNRDVMDRMGAINAADAILGEELETLQKARKSMLRAADGS